MESLYALPLMVKAVILGIVEGLTEFLPISSTGHLILTSSLLGWDDEKASVFAIAIQTGAILAVIWYYRESIGAAMVCSPTVQKRISSLRKSVRKPCISSPASAAGIRLPGRAE